MSQRLERQAGQEQGSNIIHLDSYRRAMKPVPPTLATELNGVKLKPEERRAVLAVDAMPIRMHQRRILFAADVFMRDGALRASTVIGITPQEAATARDLVVTVPKYEALRNTHTQLQEPGITEVAVLSRTNKTREQIRVQLGLERKDAERAFQRLVDLGIFRKKSATVDAFERICGEIARLDSQSGGNFRSAAEIVVLLKNAGIHIKRPRVTLARARNRARGIVAPEGRDEARSKYEWIDYLIVTHPEEGPTSILEIIRASKMPPNLKDVDINYGLIQRRRSRLINQQRAISRVTGTGPDRTPSLPERGEAELRRVLSLKPLDVPIVLAQERRSNAVLSKLSIQAVNRAYHALAKLQDVPPLQRPTKGRPR